MLFRFRGTGASASGSLRTGETPGHPKVSTRTRRTSYLSDAGPDFPDDWTSRGRWYRGVAETFSPKSAGSMANSQHGFVSFPTDTVATPNFSAKKETDPVAYQDMHLLGGLFEPPAAARPQFLPWLKPREELQGFCDHPDC